MLHQKNSSPKGEISCRWKSFNVLYIFKEVVHTHLPVMGISADYKVPEVSHEEVLEEEQPARLAESGGFG